MTVERKENVGREFIELAEKKKNILISSVGERNMDVEISRKSRVGGSTPVGSFVDRTAPDEHVNTFKPHREDSFVTAVVDGQSSSVRSGFIVGLNGGVFRNTYKPRKIKGERVVDRDVTGEFGLTEEQADKGIFVLGIKQADTTVIGLGFLNYCDKELVYDALLDFLNGTFIDLKIVIVAKRLVSLEAVKVEDNSRAVLFSTSKEAYIGDGLIGGIKENIIPKMSEQGLSPYKVGVEVHEFQLAKVCKKRYDEMVKFQTKTLSHLPEHLRMSFGKFYNGGLVDPTLAGSFEDRERMSKGLMDEFESKSGLKLKFSDGRKLKRNAFFDTIHEEDCYFFYVDSPLSSSDKALKLSSELKVKWYDIPIPVEL